MAGSRWKTWGEITEITRTRVPILWGASHWAERTLAANVLGQPPKYLADSNAANLEATFAGLPLRAPVDVAAEERSSVFVIICTGQFAGVIETLEGFGFVQGEDFCCCPLLKVKRSIEDIKGCERTLVISSPEHSFDDRTGGGLYTYRISPSGPEIRKVYSGKCRQLVRAEGGFHVVDMLKGVVELDEDFQVVRTLELERQTEPHGLALDVVRDRYIVAQPGRDSLAVYDRGTGELIQEAPISDKWAANKKDNHHVNDLWIDGDTLYVSMFSATGNWLREVYDGVILDVSLPDMTVRGEAVKGLWMPHSVSVHDGRLSYLNSMLGELFSGSSHRRISRFSGYCRGLAWDGKFWFVGVSENHYPERVAGLVDTLLVDCGIHMFDPVSKLARFHRFDRSFLIHSMVAV